MTNIEKKLLLFVVVLLTTALWPKLPHFALLATSVFILIFCYNAKNLASISVVSAVIVCFSLQGYSYLYPKVEKTIFEQNVVVTGLVDSLLTARDLEKEQINFVFSVKTMGNQKVFLSFLKPYKLRVNWRNPSFKIQQGNVVKLVLNISKPIALQNEYSFDYQKWLLSNNISAQSYVKQSPTNRLIDSHITYRQYLSNRLDNIDSDFLAWAKALVIGDRSLFEDSHWDKLQSAGIAHLFAISGMHLGCVFVLAILLFKTLLKLTAIRVSFSIYDLRILSYGPALLLCGVYSIVAGAQTPVVRALVFVSIFCVLSLSNRYWSKVHYLLITLLLCLMLMPFAHYSLSFYLSFGAVLLVFYLSWRNARSIRHENVLAKLWQALKIQSCMCVIMLPISFIFFDVVPLGSLIANLILIPFVSLIVLPYCLVFLIPLSLEIVSIEQLNSLFLPLEMMLKACLVITERCDWGDISYLIPAPFSMRLSACIFIVVVGLFVLAHAYSFKLFVVGSILVSATFFYQHRYSNSPSWQLIAFDVGQGTSVLLEKQSRYILFDTGGAVEGRYSMVNSVLKPYFEARNITRLDYVFLSHFDNDHAGGMVDLIELVKVERIYSPAEQCHKGLSVRWQNLHLKALWPLEPKSGDKNNHSCVIKIDDGYFSALLPGDIEVTAEQTLISNSSQEDLSAKVLFAPHHGSNTSSSREFIDAVSPKDVIFNAGYGNRWGFPHQKVIERYLLTSAGLHQTGVSGQIYISVYQEHYKVRHFLADKRARWYVFRELGH